MFGYLGKIKQNIFFSLDNVNMFKYLLSFIYTQPETNSLCPNSFSLMPGDKFHNFAIERVEPDEDDPEC